MSAAVGTMRETMWADFVDELGRLADERAAQDDERGVGHDVEVGDGDADEGEALKSRRPSGISF